MADRDLIRKARAELVSAFAHLEVARRSLDAMELPDEALRERVADALYALEAVREQYRMKYDRGYVFPARPAE